MRWKIIGYTVRNYRAKKASVLCYMDAESYEAVMAKARSYFGSDYVIGAELLYGGADNV